MSEKERKSKVTKKQKGVALNEFFETDIPWDKLKDDDLDAFIEKVTDIDGMCKKYYCESKDPVKLFREIGMLRLEKGFESRMSLLKGLVELSGGMGLMELGTMMLSQKKE